MLVLGGSYTNPCMQGTMHMLYQTVLFLLPYSITIMHWIDPGRRQNIVITAAHLITIVPIVCVLMSQPSNIVRVKMNHKTIVGRSHVIFSLINNSSSNIINITSFISANTQLKNTHIYIHTHTHTHNIYTHTSTEHNKHHVPVYIIRAE